MKTIITILAFIFSLNLIASEADAWTYSHIELEDSRHKINKVFNWYLDQALAETNLDLEQDPTLSDKELETRFINNYRKQIHLTSMFDNVFGRFELCVASNDCDSWPEIERILLIDGESIYDEVNYSKVTTKFLAPILNLCSVRMGADKLSHLFTDGLIFYDISMDSQHQMDAHEIKRFSKFLENTYMGAQLTGVYSPADIEANIQGQKMYHAIIHRSMFKMKNKLYRLPIDVCNYITDKLDERVNLSKFSIIDKEEDILEVIEQRKLKSENINRNEVLSRKEHNLEMTFNDILEAAFNFSTDTIFSRDSLLLYRYLNYENNPEQRKEINFSKN